jgi:hypothetical protein
MKKSYEITLAIGKAKEVLETLLYLDKESLLVAQRVINIAISKSLEGETDE